MLDKVHMKRFAEPTHSYLVSNLRAVLFTVSLCEELGNRNEKVEPLQLGVLLSGFSISHC